MSKTIRFYSSKEIKELKELKRKTPPNGISSAIKDWALVNNRPFTGAYNKVIRMYGKLGKRKKRKYNIKPKGLIVHSTTTGSPLTFRFSIKDITFGNNIMEVHAVPL
jgi:hypothetical protein